MGTRSLLVGISMDSLALAQQKMYNSKDGSVKLVYTAQPRPKAIASLAEQTIVNVACGTNHTVAVDSNGYVYTWGFGGYGSYSGWNIRVTHSGSMHHFIGADNLCISCGLAQYGELGYGPNGQKSSAIPKKVEILEGMHVISVACGLGYSKVVVDRTNVMDRLEQLEVYDGKDVKDKDSTMLKPNIL